MRLFGGWMRFIEEPSGATATIKVDVVLPSLAEMALALSKSRESRLG